MNNNPYTGIIHTLREKHEESKHIGKVLSTDPLRVSYSGIDFEADEIYIYPEAEVSDGDSVCVLPSGDDIIVLCKVVKANE